MSGRRLGVVFAIAFAAALVVLAPLQLVLPRLALPPGLSAVEIRGSLWRGRLRGLHWRGVDLGDAGAAFSPLHLFAGRQRLALRTGTAALDMETGRLRGIGAADGVLPLPALSGLALRASFEDARLLFDAGGCREAGGRVRIEAALPGDLLPPVILAGTPACRGAAGTLALASEDAAGPLRLEATLSIEADGRYALQALARSDDPAVRAGLLLAGFQDAPGGLSRVDAGHLGH